MTQMKDPSYLQTTAALQQTIAKSVGSDGSRASKEKTHPQVAEIGLRKDSATKPPSQSIAESTNKSQPASANPPSEAKQIELELDESVPKLHQLIRDKHTNEVLRLLKTGESSWDEQDNKGNTGFHIAAQEGNTVLVKYFIHIGADLHARDNAQWTPLHCATWHRHKDVIELLLDAERQQFGSIDIDVLTSAQRTPFYLAIQKRSEETARLLWEFDERWRPDPNKSTSSDRFPLYTAASLFADPSLLRFILECGADPNKTANAEETSLHKACLKGDPDCVQVLIDGLANVDLFDRFQTTPLFLACKDNCIGVVRVLLAAGADPNISRSDGVSPLEVARVNRFVEIESMLVDHGAVAKEVVLGDEYMEDRTCKYLYNQSSCPIFREVRHGNNFSQSNLDHLTKFSHHVREECTDGFDCESFRRMGRYAGTLADECHMRVFRHPARYRLEKSDADLEPLKLQDESASEYFSEQQTVFHDAVQEAIVRYCGFRTDLFYISSPKLELICLVLEVIENGFSLDLLKGRQDIINSDERTCREAMLQAFKDSTIQDLNDLTKGHTDKKVCRQQIDESNIAVDSRIVTIMSVVKEKMKHPKFIQVQDALDKHGFRPLTEAHLLSIILYTSGSCNYDLTKSMMQGGQVKWPIWICVLGKAIYKFHYVEKNWMPRNKPLYSGLAKVNALPSGKNRDDVIRGSFLTFVSTSRSEEMAQQFVKERGAVRGQGVVLRVHPNVVKYLPCYDVSWISPYEQEAEVLFASWHMSQTGLRKNFVYKPQNNVVVDPSCPVQAEYVDIF